MRILRVHENVMTVMVNVLGRTQRTEVAQGEINQMADSAAAQTAKVVYFLLDQRLFHQYLFLFGLRRITQKWL